ncbi:MAG: metallophosphoesterase [archaeon]|nr:metallophosphoesterase [archaeon]
MKILAIGDPHGSLEKVRQAPIKDADLILLTGDLGSANLARKMTFDNIEREKQGLPEIEYSSAKRKKAFMEEYTSTMRLIRHLSKFAPVFTIFGNVEFSNYETKKYSRKIGLYLPYLYNNLNSINRVRIINNVIANFEGIKIGGLEYFTDTNWVKEFKPSDYKERLVKAKKETDKAKRVLRWFNSLDILVCHQPPYRVLDKVTAKFAPKHWQGKHAGSQAILQYIKFKSPKYVFCGHIHEGQGMKRIGKTEVYNLGAGGYKLIEL